MIRIITNLHFTRTNFCKCKLVYSPPQQYYLLPTLTLNNLTSKTKRFEVVHEQLQPLIPSVLQGLNAGV